jgi:hypothetical protein
VDLELFLLETTPDAHSSGICTVEVWLADEQGSDVLVLVGVEEEAGGWGLVFCMDRSVHRIGDRQEDDKPDL